MARDAIGLARVIKRGGQPRSGRVTQTTLTREMIGGFISRVAGRTVGETGMIERRRLPGIGRMAGAALTREVVGGLISGVA
jgi:hypothetical protein